MFWLSLVYLLLAIVMFRTAWQQVREHNVDIAATLALIGLVCVGLTVFGWLDFVGVGL